MAKNIGLTAYGVGVERGYVSREQAVQRTLVTLRFLAAAPQSDGEDDTALIPFDWISDAKLVLTDALMKRGAAIRAARGEPEDDGLPEGAAEDATDTTTPSEDNA